MTNLITKFFFIFLITLIGNQTFAQTITLNSAVPTSNQTICINTALMNVEYLVLGGATNATISGLPNGVTGNYSAGIFTISGTPTESGNFSYTVTTDGATPATATGNINVDDVASVGQGWNSNLCLNSTATISDFAVSSGTYLWTHNGAGSVANQTTTMPTYTPAQGDVGNTVTLTLVVTSNNSCPTSTATTSFTYNVKGVPSFTGNLYTYVGSTVQMIGSPGHHQYYPWMSSDGSVATIDNTGLVTGVALGSTTITYQDTNNCNVAKTLKVVTLVIPSISGPSVVCSGSAASLVGTETAMDTNPWVSSNTSIATVSSGGLVMGITSGTTVITYTNSTGGTATQTIVVNATPSISVNAQTICNGASATLVATPSITGGTYLWGGNETTQSITVNPTTTSNYTVVYSLNGCSSNQSLGVVTVNPIPSVNAGADITVCSGTSVTLSGSGAQSYSWSNSITNGTSFIPSLSTNYTLTGTSNGCSATDVVNVTVNPTPNLVITNPVAICSPNTVDVTSPAVTSGSTGGGTLSYWTDANCTTSLGSPSAIINAGPIYIKSTLGACSDVKQVTVTINSQPSITGNLSTYATSTTQLTGSATAAVNTPWLSSNTGIATVSNTGLVTGIASGTSTITYTNNNGCSNTALVTVGALNTITLSSAVGTDNQTICANTPITNITYTTTGATGANFSGLPSGIIGNWISNSITLSGTATISGTYNYIITLTGGNGSITKSGIIVVNTQPSLSISNPTAVCSPSNIDLTNAGITSGSTGGGTLTYWTNVSSTVVLANHTAIAASGTYYIKSTLGACSDVKSVVATINSQPVISGVLSTYATSTTQLTGSATAAVNTPWLSSNIGVATVSTTGLVTGIASGSTTITYTNNSGCSNTAVVTVGALNTITLSSSVGTDNQTICTNTSMSSVSYSTTGATGASFSGLPTGVNGNWNANTVTISGTPSVSGSFNYTITLTGGNGVVTKTGLIQVSTLNTVLLSSTIGTDNQTVCLNTSITNITYSTTGATGASFSGLPSGVNGSWSSNVATITGNAGIAGNYTYTVTLTGGCGLVTQTGSIQVTPINTAILSSTIGTDNQTICLNTSITNITYSTTGATGASFSGLPSGSNGSWSSNIATITGIAGIAGNYNYTVTLTGGCGVVTQTGTLTISPNNTITLASAVGTDNQFICEQNKMIDISYTKTGATTGTFSGLPTGVSGNMNDEGYITLKGVPSTAGVYNYLITLTDGCGSITKSGKINVDALPVATITSSQTVCKGSTVTISGASVSNGTILWTHDGAGSLTNQTTLTPTYIPNVSDNNVVLTLTATSNNSCVSNITAEMSNVAHTTLVVQDCASPVLTITNPTAVCSPITVDLTSAAVIAGSTGGGTLTYWSDALGTVALVTPAAISTSGTYYIKSTNLYGFDIKSVVVSINNCISNSITLSSAVGTDNQTVCVNSPITTITYSTTGATGATFSGLPAGIGGSWSGNTVTITGTSSSSGTFNYVVTLTGGNGTITQNGTILINAVNSINLSTAVGTDNQTVCINSALTDIKYATTGATGANYSGLPNGVSGIFNSNQITLSGTPTTSGTFNYSITLTGGCGVTSIPGTITITPLNTIILTSAIGTDNQSICESSAIASISYSSTGATGGNFTGLPNGVTGNYMAGIFTINGTPLNSSTYIINLTGGCGTISKTGTITIDSKPTASVGASQTICGGATATITGATATNGTILWSHNGFGSISGGTTLTPTYTSTLGDAGNTVVLTMTVTSNNSCSSNSATANVSLTIQNCAAPVLTITNPSTVCSPTTVDITTSGITIGSTNLGTFTYWLDASGTITLPNPTTISNSGTYYIKSTNGNGSDIKPVVVTVNQTPNLTITNPAAVCSPNTIDLTSSSITAGSSGSGTLSYWSDVAVTSSLINPSSISVSGTFYIKSSDANCYDLKPVVVTINPAPVLTITNPSPVTSPTTVDITAPSITTGSTGNGTLTYWINPDASVPLTNPTVLSMSGTYYIKSVLGNCSDTNFVTVTIDKVSSPTTQLNAYVIPKGATQNGYCDGSAEVVVTSGTAPYTFLYSDNSTDIKAAGLCSGLKSVRVADANKDTLYINFIISSPANLKTTTTLVDSIIIDSVFNSVVTNCVLNYSKIDSAKIINYTILSNDSIRIKWNVYSNNISMAISNVYSMKVISNAGVYSFALQIYCPNKLSGNFLTAYDQLYISTIDISSADLKEVEKYEFSIFPNPFNNKIFVKSDYDKNFEIQLTDITGKVIKFKTINSKDNTIETNDLIPGNYLLIIKSDDFVKMFKVCK